MKWSLTILIFLVLLWCVQAVYYYPKLPDKTAIHFNSQEQPDNWGRKEVMFLFSFMGLGVILFSTILLPWALNRFAPDEWVNLPNRNYWLAEERRDETKRYIQIMMNGFGVATTVWVLSLFEMVYRANLREPVQLSNSAPRLTIGYFIFIAVWTILFVSKFYRVKNKGGQTRMFQP